MSLNDFKILRKNILLAKSGGAEVAEENMEQFHTFVYLLN